MASGLSDAPEPPDMMRDSDVNKTMGLATAVLVFVVGGVAVAYSQGILLNFAAERVIQKYQTSTCEQLKQMRSEGPSFKEKEAIEYLHSDDQARVAFIDKIAAPVANKMFECDMFP